MEMPVRRLVALALAVMLLPLPAMAQDATPAPDLSSDAGLQNLYAAQRAVTAEEVGLPPGFTLQLVASGLDAPIGLAVAL